MSEYRIELHPVWPVLVRYYWDVFNRAEGNENLSIWGWLERDYGALRTEWINNRVRMSTQHMISFGSAEDMLAFKLKFASNMPA